MIRQFTTGTATASRPRHSRFPSRCLPDGEFYVVQRGHSILNGRVVQPGRIEGSIDTQLFEQRVLGAWPGFLNQSAEVEPDPKESRFVLTQVAGVSSCETLLSAGKS